MVAGRLRASPPVFHEARILVADVSSKKSASKPGGVVSGALLALLTVILLVSFGCGPQETSGGAGATASIASIDRALATPGEGLEPLPAAPEGVEEAISVHLREARAAVGRRLIAESPKDEEQLALARAYGDLGLAAQVYDLPELALPAYANAAALAHRVGRDDEAGAWLDYRGEVLRQGGRFKEAVSALRTAAEWLPEDRPVRLRLGEALLSAGEPEPAETVYRTLVIELAAGAGAKTPTGMGAAAHAGLGRALLDQGQPREALDALRRARDLDPRADRLRYWLGRAHRAAGDREAAAVELAAAGRRLPVFPDPRMAQLVSVARSPSFFRQRGGRALQDGQIEAAIAAYRRAVELDPQHLAGRQGLSSALRRSGNVEGAREHLAAAIALAPEDLPTARALAEVNRELGQPAEAVRVLRAALAIATDGTDGTTGTEDAAGAALELGQALQAGGDAGAAIAAFDDAHQRAMAGGWMKLAREARLGELVLRSRRPGPAGEEALAQLQQLASSSAAGVASEGTSAADGSAAVTLALARALAARGEAAAAVESYRNVLVLAPDRLEARFELAGQLGQLGRYVEAARAYGRVVAADPTSVVARLGEATALTLAGEDRQARDRLAAALTEGSREPALALALARLLATSADPQVRDPDAAQVEARRVLETAPSADAGETLALALAAAGRFQEAAGLQEQLLQQLEGSPLANRPEGAALVQRLRSTLAAYRDGRLPPSGR